MTVSFTSATATSALVDVAVFTLSGSTAVYQWYLDGQSFAAGQTRSYAVSWPVPADAVVGQYRVSLGVFAPAWASVYAWTDQAGTFSVTAPAATPTPMPTPAPTPVPPAGFSALHVQGNKFVNASGQTVQLRGMNRSGSEYMCWSSAVFDGPADAASITAIKSWHVNVVRIPLNEDCWLGINGVAPGLSGASYQQAIKDYVSLLNQQGLYAILDLHHTAPGSQQAKGQMQMPDQDHAPAFWSSVASAFKGNNSVIFEPFNEPWPGVMDTSAASWTCWRDGGSCPGLGFSYQVAGMQSLVNAIRATGATNVIVQGGLEWSNYLSTDWLVYRPSDPLNNMGATWHGYSTNLCNNVACYNSQIAPVAAQVPVIGTEIGTDTCDTPWVNTTLDWLDAHGVSYTMWAWDVWGMRLEDDPNSCASSALITDYDGTPTTPYGQAVKEYYARWP